MNDINLLPQKTNQSSRSYLVLRIMRITSAISILVLALSSVVLILLKLQSPLPKLKAEENALLSQITAMKEKAIKLAIIHDRLDGIQKTVNQRKDFNRIIDRILEDISSDTKVQSFSLDKNTVRLTIFSSSLSSIDSFLNSLVNLAANKKEVLERLTLESLSLDEKNGGYFISLEGKLL